MNYTMLLEELETDQYLDGESSDELFAESVVIVADYELVQIIAE